jgi:hypothetical protein
VRFDSYVLARARFGQSIAHQALEASFDGCGINVSSSIHPGCAASGLRPPAARPSRPWGFLQKSELERVLCVLQYLVELLQVGSYGPPDVPGATHGRAAINSSAGTLSDEFFERWT